MYVASENWKIVVKNEGSEKKEPQVFLVLFWDFFFNFLKIFFIFIPVFSYRSQRRRRSPWWFILWMKCLPSSIFVCSILFSYRGINYFYELLIFYFSAAEKEPVMVQFVDEMLSLVEGEISALCGLVREPDIWNVKVWDSDF